MTGKVNKGEVKARIGTSLTEVQERELHFIGGSRIQKSAVSFCRCRRRPWRKAFLNDGWEIKVAVINLNCLF